MISSRQAILQKITDLNRQSCLAYYEKDKAVWNRLFNGFPNLLPEEKLTEFTFQFQRILKELEVVIKDDKIIIDTKDKNKINQWGAEIISAACQFLLDKKSIQLDVIKALGLEDKANPSQPELIHAMVSSLVGNIILEQIMSPLEEMIRNHQLAYNAICIQINANYPLWVNKELKQCGVEVKPEHMIRAPFIFRLLAEPKKALTIAAVLTGALAVGVALFRAFESKAECKETYSHSNRNSL